MAQLTYIIPTYNSARTIERTILSIMNQPGGNPKIIVVDDGSTDDTLNVLAGYDGKLTLLQQPNAGPSAARNRGLEAVGTEIVCFVDADDYVIGPHRQSMEERWNKDIDMIIGLFAEGNDDYVMLSNRNKYGQTAPNEMLLRHFICNNWVQTSTICWSTEFLKKIGGWDEKVFGVDDIELAMRAFLHSPRTILSSAACWIVYHTQPDPKRLSQISNLRWAAGQLWMHTKIMSLIENANSDEETIRLFLQRCMGVGRVVYLSGFHEEAIGLFSIAWNRGYVKHNGPRVEAILANVFGTTWTLAARRFVAACTRKLHAAYQSNNSVRQLEASL